MGRSTSIGPPHFRGAATANGTAASARGVYVPPATAAGIHRYSRTSMNPITKPTHRVQPDVNIDYNSKMNTISDINSNLRTTLDTDNIDNDTNADEPHINLNNLKRSATEAHLTHTDPPPRTVCPHDTHGARAPNAAHTTVANTAGTNFWGSGEKTGSRTSNIYHVPNLKMQQALLHPQRPLTAAPAQTPATAAAAAAPAMTHRALKGKKSTDTWSRESFTRTDVAGVDANANFNANANTPVNGQEPHQFAYAPAPRQVPRGSIVLPDHVAAKVEAVSPLNRQEEHMQALGRPQAYSPAYPKTPCERRVATTDRQNYSYVEEQADPYGPEMWVAYDDQGETHHDDGDNYAEPVPTHYAPRQQPSHSDAPPPLRYANDDLPWRHADPRDIPRAGADSVTYLHVLNDHVLADKLKLGELVGGEFSTMIEPWLTTILQTRKLEAATEVKLVLREQVNQLAERCAELGRERATDKEAMKELIQTNKTKTELKEAIETIKAKEVMMF
jgi:hypothetical protein